MMKKSESRPGADPVSSRGTSRGRLKAGVEPLTEILPILFHLDEVTRAAGGEGDQSDGDEGQRDRRGERSGEGRCASGGRAEPARQRCAVRKVATEARAVDARGDQGRGGLEPRR